MSVFNGYGQAYATCLALHQRTCMMPSVCSLAPSYLAVEEILPQALPDAANPTIVAVIYALLGIIVPKLAKIAIILCGLLAAFSTPLCSRLSMSTKHAKHILCLVPNEMMALDLIVTESACVPLLACIAL